MRMSRGRLLAVPLGAAACAGDDQAQIETNPDEMSEEALACLQDEVCLERIGQDALDEATEVLETTTAENESTPPGLV
jgi:hypothetical protein